MPPAKPKGWPRYMVDRRLKDGTVAYYHVVPVREKKKGCTLGCTALGSDYGVAKARCDDILNPQLRAWQGKDGEVTRSPTTGTLDWLFAVYRASSRYSNLPKNTRRDYDRVLAGVANLEGKDKRRVGSLGVKSFTGDFADKLYEAMKLKADGGTRGRTAVLAMTCCKLAWNAAQRSKPQDVPLFNPFAAMRLSHEPEQTRPATFDELMRFVAYVDRQGEHSLGTAAMIAFFWIQRQTDIIGRLSWSRYRPGGRPIVQVWHHKTGAQVDLPLIDDDGSLLWPELSERLDRTERLGSLIVMRSQPDRRTGTHLPWKVDYFRSRFAEARVAAGIDSEVKFMGLRHGGVTDGADAGLTEPQLRALSGHKSAAALRIYTRETDEQRKVGARKRRDHRAKKGESK